jgi:hypothetical protein
VFTHKPLKEECGRTPQMLDLLVVILIYTVATVQSHWEYSGHFEEKKISAKFFPIIPLLSYTSKYNTSHWYQDSPNFQSHESIASLLHGRSIAFLLHGRSLSKFHQQRSLSQFHLSRDSCVCLGLEELQFSNTTGMLHHHVALSLLRSAHKNTYSSLSLCS